MAIIDIIINLLIGLVIGCVATIIYEYIFDLIWYLTGKQPIISIFGWHLHHSLYGIFVIIIFFLLFINYIFLGIGLGVIIRHTQDEKFVFIDRHR